MYIIYIDIKRFLIKVSAHVITETEKSHNLLSASWRPRKVGGIV